jgi:amino acid adenylation domain-containing protein
VSARAPEVVGYRLSPRQRRLALVQRAVPSGAIRIGVLLEGAVEAEAVRRSVEGLVARHAILRTVILPDERGVPVLQAIRDEMPPAWDEIAPRALASAAEVAEEWFSSAPSFDLGGGPVVRASLLELAPRRSLLLVALPLPCADARSIDVLVDDLAASVATGAAERDVPVQYVDVSEWQWSVLEDEDAPGARYWRVHRPERDAHVLPFRRHAAASGAMVLTTGRALDDGLGEAVARLAFEARIAVDDVLLTAWAITTWRLAAPARDVTIVAVADGRDDRELADVVGPVATPLPLRWRVDARASFRDTLAAVSEGWAAARGALASFAPSESLSAAPEPGGVGFEVIEAHGPVTNGALTATVVLRDAPADWCAIALVVTRDGARWTVAARHDTGVYAPDEAARVVDHFVTLLAEAVTHPELPIARLPLVPRSAAMPRVEAAAGGALVHELIVAQAAAHPDVPAVRAGARALTFAELEARASRLARRLRGLAVGPDVAVGLRVGRSEALLVAVLGILKAGGAYVPLDRALPPARLATVVADARLGIVVTERAEREALRDLAVTAVCLDDDVSVEADRCPLPACAVAPDNLAYVLFTSGSTGRPKGVMISHGALANYVTWAAQTYTGGGAGAPVQTAIGFDLTVTSLLVPLVVGQPVTVLPDDVGPEALAAALAEGPAFSFVKITPLQLAALSEWMPPSTVAGRAGAFVIGGEALFHKTLAFWRAHASGTRLLNEYGPTETTVGCCLFDATAPGADDGAVPIGTPIANAIIALLDAELEPVPDGVLGELYIGGPGLARGYLGEPALTAERFVPDPRSGRPGARLYRTGDLARRRADGVLEFVGRADQQVKLRGFRIELGDIEAALIRHPAIREAVVVLREDGGRPARLVAYVVVEAEPPARDAFAAFVARELPAYMVPAAFVPLPALPRTANGKVDRRALPAPEAVVPRRSASLAQPTSERQRLIARVWADVLGVDDVGLDDSFFDLGGHSFLLVRACRRLRDVIEADLKVVDLFEHPTVRTLAAFLGDDADTTARGDGAARGSRRREAMRRTSVDRERRAFGVVEDHAP